MKKIVGEVTYILRDLKTDEIILQNTEKNIITKRFYKAINGVLNTERLLQPRISLVTTNVAASIHTYLENTPNTSTTYFKKSPDLYLPSVGRYVSISPYSDISDTYIEVNGRYNAPSSGTITYKGINLIDASYSNVYTDAFQINYTGSSLSPDDFTGGITASTGNRRSILAFLKFYTPIVQTETQVLDIYYRIYFPYIENEYNLLGRKDYYGYIRGLFTYGYNNYKYSTTSVFKLPEKLKQSDVNIASLTGSAIGYAGTPVGSGNLAYSLMFQNSVNAGIRYNYYPMNPEPLCVNYTHGDFLNQAGSLVASKQTYLYTNDRFENFPGGNTGYAQARQYLLKNINLSNTLNTNKIGTVFSRNTLTSNPLSPVYLDIDNFVSGSGKVYVEGTWDNIGTPNSPGLYYPAKMPELLYLKIVDSGAVGTASYKLIRENHLGFNAAQYPSVTSNTDQYSNYTYSKHYIKPLCAVKSGTADVVYSETILEDLTYNYFDLEQLTSCCAYDDSSIIFVKKNKIIIYNIPAGDYWKIEGSYTNIHQIAVLNNTIYIACYNTGLWSVNPYNSLTPTSLSSIDPSIDLSKCYGVAEGYNGTLWAVANNCLCSFDGTAWTKYDSTTTPSINIAGVTDNNWSNIGYLKVDKSSTSNNMLLVRKEGATVDNNSLGVWWSTTTSALNVTSFSGITTNTNYYTRPRKHRGHIVGQDDIWAVAFQNSIHSIRFNNTVSPASLGNYSSFSWAFGSLNSLLVLETSTGQKGLLNKTSNGNANYLGYSLTTNSASNRGYTKVLYRLINESNTVVLSQPVGEILDYNNYGYLGSQASYYTVDSDGFQYNRGHNFLMPNGYMVTVGDYNATQNSLQSASYINTSIMVFGLGITQQDTPISHYARKEYGWDGSNWVLNNQNAKLTHVTSEPLYDGVTVRFEDGVSGTSFNTNNYHFTTLFDGLVKDNISKYKFEFEMAQSVPKNQETDLEMSTVPIIRTGETGDVLIDIYQCSEGVTIDSATNSVLFPGHNQGQYAIGTKALVGDFILSFDATSLGSEPIINSPVAYGITRAAAAPGFADAGSPYIGIYCRYDNNLYVKDGFNYNPYGTETGTNNFNASTTTSLEIRRVGDQITIWRNGSSYVTWNPTRTSTHNATPGKITQGTPVLDVCWFTGNGYYEYNYKPEGVAAPKATITSNGSAIWVDMGDPIARTGRYQAGFSGIDVVESPPTVTLDGVTLTPKWDGTAPSAGEVAIDPYRGTLYFNEADVGKSISATYTCLTI